MGLLVGKKQSNVNEICRSCRDVELQLTTFHLPFYQFRTNDGLRGKI